VRGALELPRSAIQHVAEAKKVRLLVSLSSCLALIQSHLTLSSRSAKALVETDDP